MAKSGSPHLGQYSSLVAADSERAAVSALDKVVLKFRSEGAEVEIVGLNEASATWVDRLAEHDKPGALERMLEH